MSLWNLTEFEKSFEKMEKSIKEIKYLANQVCKKLNLKTEVPKVFRKSPSFDTYEIFSPLVRPTLEKTIPKIQPKGPPPVKLLAPPVRYNSQGSFSEVSPTIIEESEGADDSDISSATHKDQALAHPPINTESENSDEDCYDPS